MVLTTLGNKLTLLDVANGKAVCRMLQISQPITSFFLIFFFIVIHTTYMYNTGTSTYTIYNNYTFYYLSPSHYNSITYALLTMQITGATYNNTIALHTLQNNMITY